MEIHRAQSRSGEIERAEIAIRNKRPGNKVCLPRSSLIATHARGQRRARSSVDRVVPDRSVLYSAVNGGPRQNITPAILVDQEL